MLRLKILHDLHVDHELTGEQYLMIAIIERATLDALGCACEDADTKHAKNWFFVKEKKSDIFRGITAHQAFAALALDFGAYKTKLWALILDYAANPHKKPLGYQRLRVGPNRRLKSTKKIAYKKRKRASNKC